MAEPTRRELTVWRDRGYDDFMDDPEGDAKPPDASKPRAAYFEGRRAARTTIANGDDGAMASQRHRRPSAA